MGKIKVTPCDIKGLYVIEPSVFPDSGDILWRLITRMILRKQDLTWYLCRTTSPCL